MKVPSEKAVGKGSPLYVTLLTKMCTPVIGFKLTYLKEVFRLLVDVKSVEVIHVSPCPFHVVQAVGR